MLDGIKPVEILIIVGVLVLLFGAKKLPDTARGLGRSLRIFKSEIKASDDDEADAAAKQITVTREDATPPPAAQPAAQPAPTSEQQPTEH
jgi:sec-independent protein translocase protein TatA